MAYISAKYYMNEFMGTPADDMELAALIIRASDIIDIITQYRIQNFDSLPARVQSLVKKATAYQVEYLAQNGGLATANSGQGVAADNVTIGRFSMAQSRTEKQRQTDTRICPMAISCLSSTGLLYRGIDTI